MRVVVIFHRFGPYHVARLAAAANQMRMTAIELSAETAEYAWDQVATAERFERVTVFPEGDSRAADRGELQHRLNSTLNELRPEVVVVPGWADAGALVAVRWGIQKGVPIVTMSESSALDESRSIWKEWVKRQVVAGFSAGFAGGTSHAGYLAQLGLPRERIFLGYDAVDNDYFAAGTEKVRGQLSVVRGQLGLPEKYFLASARFIEKKNLPRLIQAYARYRALVSQPSTFNRQPSTTPWSLVLLGDGPLRSDLCRLISDLRLQHSVLLPGFKQYPDLPAYYGCASAFIHASTTEQWGLVVNEAMACGLPVLVSKRCGCARDLVQEGVNGFTFDPHDVEQLAQLMLKISAFSFPLSQFGAESARFISQWGPERFAEGLVAAAQAALRAGPVNPTLTQRMILKALLAR